MVTASEVPTILLRNKYEQPDALLRSKVTGEKKTGWFMQRACDHGNTHEPIAIQKYEQATGHKTMPFGLIRHAEHSWMGASPDAVTYCGRNVEIKCPLSRKVFPGNPVPEHYLDQLHMQMECMDLNVSDFVQWATPTDSREEVFDIQEVKRNKGWFSDNELRLRSFHQKMLLCFMEEMPLPEEKKKKRRKTNGSGSGSDEDPAIVFRQSSTWLPDPDPS